MLRFRFVNCCLLVLAVSLVASYYSTSLTSTRSDDCHVCELILLYVVDVAIVAVATMRLVIQLLRNG